MPGARRWILALALASCLGCAEDGESLQGSVSAYYPLGFLDVRARLYGSELAIEYVQADGEAVVRLTVRRAEHDPAGPGRIDLAAVGDITGSADGAELPAFGGGDLVLSDYRPRDGALVSGRFDAVMVAGAVTLTLSGTFEARLDVVEGL